jgi:hypothetical protein
MAVPHGRSTWSLDPVMLDATAVKRLRRATVLGAIASWASLSLLIAVALWIVLARAPVKGASGLAQELLEAGVLICFGLWVLAFLDAWPLRCPRCNQRLLISYRLPAGGGTSLRNVYDQFWPKRLLNEARITCPTCAAVLRFGGADGV